MDGLFHGSKPYEQMDDLGAHKNPYFWVDTHIDFPGFLWRKTHGKVRGGDLVSLFPVADQLYQTFDRKCWTAAAVKLEQAQNDVNSGCFIWLFWDV